MTGLKKVLTGSLAALALYGAAVSASSPAAAWRRGGGWGAGPFIGGLAAGAIIGGALAPRYAYPPAYAYGPAYESCWRRAWGPYGWHWVSYC